MMEVSKEAVEIKQWQLERLLYELKHQARPPYTDKKAFWVDAEGVYEGVFRNDGRVIQASPLHPDRWKEYQETLFRIPHYIVGVGFFDKVLYVGFWAYEFGENLDIVKALVENILNETRNASTTSEGVRAGRPFLQLEADGED